MNDMQPLLALLGQAERERDTCFAQREHAAGAHAAALAQAGQLHAYRADYQSRWAVQFARAGQIEVVRCYQGFMDRLTQAVDQQARIAEHTGSQLERARGLLIEQEQRVASVRKLIERRVGENRLLADRRDQKQTDEFAARAAWHAASALQPMRLT